MDIDYTEPYDDHFPIEGIDYPCYDEYSEEYTLNSDLEWKPIRFNPALWDDDNDKIPFQSY